MAASPPAFLRLTAALLGTRPGLAITRRTFLALIERGWPLSLVETLANEKPSSHFEAAISPILLALDPGRAARSGPLAGGTVVVKDSIDVAGTPTALGLSDPGEHAENDALLVSRIREAGGQLIGKAKMTELGMDGIGALLPGEMPRNPVAPGYLPGGSSTGTAVAVALGLARYGVGGDGLGSVRIPAAFCGLVGLKPGIGVLPFEGYRSVAPSMDVPGPIARTVADAARLFQVMAGHTVTAVSAKTPPAVGLVAGLGPELASRAERRAFARVLDALSLPRRAVIIEGGATFHALAVAASTSELARSAYASRTASGQGLMNVTLGRALQDDRALIEERRARLRRATLAALDEVEVLAMPTTAIPPPAITEGLLGRGQDLFLLRAIGAYTPLANLLQFPAITVPSGRDERGRPLGIMFLGRPGSEGRLFELAQAVEATELGAEPI